MKKILLPFFLLLFLLSLFSCTLTKRRYTSGYSVSWHNKTSDVSPIRQIKTTVQVPNKIVQINSNYSNAVAAAKTITHQITQAITASPKEKEIIKSIASNSPITTRAVSYYNTDQGHSIFHRDMSPGLRGFVNTIAFLLLDLLAFGLILLADSNGSLAFLSILGVLIAIAGLISFIVGLINNIRGLNPNDANRDLAGIGLILDVLTFIGLVITFCIII
jgi:hypothetical protein